MSFLSNQLLLASICLSLFSHVQADSLSSNHQTESIQVEITTHLGDAQTFIKGDSISFLLSLNKASYIYLFYEDADGQILQLVPNYRQSNNFFQQGFFMTIPDNEAGFKFIVQAPFGNDKLWVFAVDNPVPEFSVSAKEKDLKLLDLSLSKIKQIIKNQAIKYYGSNQLVIKTKAR